MRVLRVLAFAVACLLPLGWWTASPALVVVAAAFPSLWLLSRTAAYTQVRAAGAIIALAAASAWIIERLDVASNPLGPIEDVAIEHLGLVGALVAGCAAMAWAASRGRRVGLRSIASPKFSVTGR